MSDQPAAASARRPGLFAVDLDDLLTELRDRALAVRQSQERTRALLDAVVAVSADLDLAAVLDHIVSAACTLARARYGALNVLGYDRRPAALVTYGISPEQRRLIGPLPRMHGVLGVVLEGADALRLRDVAAHPRASGFPEHHPAIRSFLGVPIQVAGEVFGNLYLGEKQGAEEFSDVDEQVVQALAAAAGTAVEKANLYELARRRQEWLEAAAEITAALLGEVRRTDALGLVARRAREVAGADIAAILLPAGTDGMVVEVVEAGDGEDAAALVGSTLRRTEALAAVAAPGGRPVVLSGDDSVVGALVATEGEAPAWPPLAQLLLVPMRSSGSTVGVLVAGRTPGHEARLSDQDVRMAAGFAEQAALALELARAQSDRARLAVYEDRDRIARDLHDLVVQRVFAVGLSLRGARRPDLAAKERDRRLDQAIADLDATVKEIRRSIFRLHRRPGEGDAGADLESVVAAAAPLLGFTPRFRTAGRVAALPDDITDDLAAVLREALSNTARHAAAHSVDVELLVTGAETGVEAGGGTGVEVVLTVSDDGRGLGGSRRRSGLANLRERAERHGGTCEVDAADGGGTRVRWRAPLPPAH